LLRDILRGGDPQIAAAAAVIAAIRPDVPVLTSLDYDHGLRGLAGFADVLAGLGVDYPHRFALRPNSGLASGLDLDGDGRRGQPEDAQGYGWFPGEGGLAILSNRPVMRESVTDFSVILWRDLPGALLPTTAGGGAFPSVAAQNAQRLPSTAHWVVPIRVTPGQVLSLLVFRATPPVFDGPEDRNGRRNHDEAAFWLRYLNGELPGHDPPPGPVAVLGNANLDTQRGAGLGDAMAALLVHPRLQDPKPRRGTLPDAPGFAGELADGGLADGGLETVDWPDGPGRQRVDYVLPDAGLRVVGSGVFWPPPGAPMAETVAAASAHRAVWVDVEIP
jgi:hypothetical protein